MTSGAANSKSTGVPESTEDRMLSYLRSEAYAVRDCFTKYSVQVLAAAAAITVAIARFTQDVPHIGLLGLFTVALILLVFSMGVHKFGTSNRLLGYELHIQRAAHFYPDDDSCRKLMNTVGWEEAMRAWRVIQPTLFAKIYSPSRPVFRRLWYITTKPSFVTAIEEENTPDGNEENGNEEKAIADEDRVTGYWFDQKRAFHRFKKDGVHYNPGGYLQTTISVFVVSILICLSLPVGEAILSWQQYADHPIVNLGIVVLVAVSVVAVLLASLNIYSRIRILETGLLSIHSAGIVWEATVLAHLSALAKLKNYQDERNKPRSMHGYTNHIAREAVAIAKEAHRIHTWIENARKWLNDDLRRHANAVPPSPHGGSAGAND
jgi:hypothetical protein